MKAMSKPLRKLSKAKQEQLFRLVWGDQINSFKPSDFRFAPPPDTDDDDQPF